MEDVDFLELAVKLIRQTRYFSVSTTCEDGQPWGSAMYTVRDSDCVFYTASWTENIHSKNIGRTGHAFLVGYDPNVDVRPMRGVFIRTHAELVDNKSEVQRILAVEPSSKMGEQIPDVYLGDAPARVYKFAPQNIWVNDKVLVNGHSMDIRKEIDIDSLRKQLRETVDA